MTSTFHGLQTATRGMNTHQSALNTTGHNIANANNEDYSRQRVNFNQTEAFPAAGRNAPMIPGQIGTGVEAGSVQRVREAYLDDQYREQNALTGYWETRHDSYERIEDLLNEPSDEGISQTMDDFWSSLQDLSANPEDSGARSVVRQRAEAVAETFNYTADSLKSDQRDVAAQLDTEKDQVNSQLRQLNELNKQIASIEPNGYLPNDLYDERDALLDDLSKTMDIEVEYSDAGGNADEIAEGIASVYMVDENGDRVGTVADDDSNNTEASVQAIVDGENLTHQEMEVNYTEVGNHENDPVANVRFINSEGNEGDHLEEGALYSERELQADSEQAGSLDTTWQILNVNGRMNSLIESHGYASDGEVHGTYPDTLKQIDDMVGTFVEEFNEVHKNGWSLSEIEDGEREDIKFFDYESDPDGEYDNQNAASNIQVSNDIRDELDNIAASGGSNQVNAPMEPTSGSPSDHPLVTGVNDSEKDLHIEVNRTGDGDDDWEVTIREGDEDGEVIVADADASSGETFTHDNDDIENLSIEIPDPNEDGVEIENGDSWSLDVPGGGAFDGDGSNALNLANVKDEELHFEEDGSRDDVMSYYEGVIGDMAVSKSEAEEMLSNTENIRGNIDNRRSSISDVSLDEEMTNMIQFQHAYNAAARNITAIDEMLDRVINQMGIVGR
ncbi:flagellar hook-associated protein 1 FlgK [Salsuginibacillus halophilus]|uniref:Flagellar hook-associated protein 1 n=1 Tax=Salsuginibacillus halophilus TaxID=517424 RepID=A0A2P8HQS0_9BACI|nr:flagellar hook-associated protein FlgK [Salsuginibacillus halophilus]PSL48571.1 flagellar hook-associated protein 1 FlgK [Salsuginibacillus halophilus]